MYIIPSLAVFDSWLTQCYFCLSYQYLFRRLAVIFFCHFWVKIALPVSVLAFSTYAIRYLHFPYLHFPPLPIVLRFSVLVYSIPWYLHFPYLHFQSPHSEHYLRLMGEPAAVSDYKLRPWEVSHKVQSSRHYSNLQHLCKIWCCLKSSQAQRPSLTLPVEHCRSVWGAQTGYVISKCAMPYKCCFPHTVCHKRGQVNFG